MYRRVEGAWVHLYLVFIKIELCLFLFLFIYLFIYLNLRLEQKYENTYNILCYDSILPYFSRNEHQLNIS